MSSTNFIITDPTQMPYYCAQCQTSSGCCQSDFEKHFAGKKHKFNVKKEKRPYYCDLCYFLSPLQNDLEKHLAGEKHKYKVQKEKMPYFCDPCYFACLRWFSVTRFDCKGA